MTVSSVNLSPLNANWQSDVTARLLPYFSAEISYNECLSMTVAVLVPVYYTVDAFTYCLVKRDSLNQISRILNYDKDINRIWSRTLFVFQDAAMFHKEDVRPQCILVLVVLNAKNSYSRLFFCLSKRTTTLLSGADDVFILKCMQLYILIDTIRIKYLVKAYWQK